MAISNNPELYIKIDSNGCWIWQKAKDKHGYGMFRIGDKMTYAHRYFYEQKFRKITKPYPYNVLDHIVCNNSSCCNPEHVQLSCIGKNGSRTHSEKTHCPRGHEYTSENTSISRNKRTCKACRKLSDSRRIHYGR